MRQLRPATTGTILLEHHPDLARRPPPRPAFLLADGEAADLAWNVFRTLALLPPPFWLRRLHARLNAWRHVPVAPRFLDVHLWPELTAADPSDPDRPRVDALVETDQSVYGFLALSGADLPMTDANAAGPDPVLRAIDAVSWRAGVREAYVVLVTRDPSQSPVACALVDRYASSPDALRRRLPHRRDGLSNVAAIGRLEWRDLASFLRDGASAPTLNELERCAAASAVRWLADIGIHGDR